MSQQLQSNPQQSTAYQPQYQQSSMGQQPNQVGQPQQVAQFGQGQQFGQMQGQRFQQSVSGEIQAAVQSLDRLETVAEWAKLQATRRGMGGLAHTCDDLKNIAHVQKQSIVRQSPFAQSVIGATRQVIQNASQQLQQYAAQPEVRDVLTESQQTVSAIDTALTQLQSTAGDTQQQISSRQQAATPFAQDL